MEMKRLKKFEAFAWGTLAYVLVVILWGAFVRATGSGAGCGDHWPLCNGQVVPRAPEVATVIEFTHRLTSGLSLVLSVALWIWARRLAPRGAAFRRYAGIALIFMLLEAAVGAGLVLLRLVADDSSVLRAVVLGIHLVNTLMLIGALLLVALAARESRAANQTRLQGAFQVFPAQERRRILPLLLLLLGVGVAGAITALGDTLFPAGSLAEGIAADLDPLSHFLLRLRIIHPVLGLLSFVYAVQVWLSLDASNSVHRFRGRVLMGLFLGQILGGLLNLALLAPVWMQLVHLLFADLLWLSAIAWRAGGVRPPA
jgi:cytochrome c oxidase assembly protein subunit 15